MGPHFVGTICSTAAVNGLRKSTILYYVFYSRIQTPYIN